MTPTISMDKLYKKIRSRLGLSKPFVAATVLPDWWDDEAAESPAGLAEAVLLLSRHLGLDPRSLREDDEIQFAPPFKAKLKSASPERDTHVAQALAVQVARLAALGAVTPVRPLPKRGSEVRDQILLAGAPWVGFEQLLDYCWAHGIVVLHVSHFPNEVKRMHGLAVRIGDRPVIVLSWEKDHPAWLLFVLAHELGHHARGHVEEGTAVVDDAIDRTSPDAEEQEANAYALEVICGSSDTRFAAGERWPKAEALAAAAREHAKELQIDPGHIVLNYAHTMGKSFFPVANAALKHISGAGAPDLVRRRLAEQIDWEKLPAESSEFVMRMTRTTKRRADPRPAASSH